jgi:hypothetical protein
MVRTSHSQVAVELTLPSLVSETARGIARSMRVTGLNLSEYSEQQSESWSSVIVHTLTFRYHRTFPILRKQQILMYEGIALLKLWVGVVSRTLFCKIGSGSDISALALSHSSLSGKVMVSLKNRVAQKRGTGDLSSPASSGPTV